MFSRRMTNTEKYAGGRGGETAGMLRTEKRAKGRLRCAKVTCSLGEVRDMSSTGARVACRKKPKLNVGESVRLDLVTEEHSVTLPSKVVWIRVQEDCSFQVGLCFEELDPLRKRKLMDVLHTGLDCEGLTRGWAPLDSERTAD